VIRVSLDEGKTVSLSAGSFFPQITVLLANYHALHELFGLAWYLCRSGHW
jgi:hypothetical protein